MTHSLANLEHHSFKYETHVGWRRAYPLLRPAQHQLRRRSPAADGDVMKWRIRFGRPLRQSAETVKGPEAW